MPEISSAEEPPGLLTKPANAAGGLLKSPFALIATFRGPIGVMLARLRLTAFTSEVGESLRPLTSPPNRAVHDIWSRAQSTILLQREMVLDGYFI